MAADPHGWASWQEYLNAHNGKLDSYRDFFLLDDRLRPDVTPEIVLWRGKLMCADGIEIIVDRLQEVRRRHGSFEVITREYTYHAVQRVAGKTRQIVRYDNTGLHGFADRHHRHVFDENEVETIEWVGKKGWPNLGQVLDEVHDCWQRWKTGETVAVVSRR
jgi:hypothetical protein